jgi:hypothetical protein
VKREYEPPEVETERAFEVLAAGCALNDPSFMTACDPEYGGTVNDNSVGS